jgi:membrane-associated phospholipid phosphatase
LTALIEWGYAVIGLLQALRTPFGDALFQALSFLGEEEFYLLLVPVLYWMVDKRLATRFAILFLLSSYLNFLLKDVLNQPRPSPERVPVLDDLDTNGVPSGHAQNGIVTWLFLAAQRRETWIHWAMVALVLGIGLSRLYLGVHFPQDVAAGWLVGAAILLGYYNLAPRIERWLGQQTLAWQIAAGAGVALLLILLYRLDAALDTMATLFGLAVGIPLERARVAFATRGMDGARLAARLVVGVVVLLLIWRGLRPFLLPLNEMGAFIRYGLVGLWVSVGAPWVFVRAGLARQEVRA